MTFPARLTELLEKATKGPFTVGSMEAPDGHAMSWHGNWYVDSEAPRVNGERYGDPESDAKLHKLFLDHAEAIRDLVVAAKKAQKAMNVWVNTYAPEFCDKEHVENSRKIISESGGTLAYIADINEQIHEALAKLEQP